MLSSANESSVQWYVQPLKIKHQVGKNQMTEVALYRFPVFMRHTHPRIMLNDIAVPTILKEYTADELNAELPNVNIANLYGIIISYDIVDDISLIDLTKVKKPKGETIPVDEVIAMVMECERLIDGYGKLTILTNEQTQKWKKFERDGEYKDRKDEKPFFTPKVVELKVGKDERLYHWSYFTSDAWGDVPGDYEVESFPPLRFPTFIRLKNPEAGTDSRFQALGNSYPLSVHPTWQDEPSPVELNHHAGYAFIKKGNVITITAATLAKENNAEKKQAFAKMKSAIKSLTLSAKSDGLERKDYELKLIDQRLTDEQIKELLEFSKKEIK
eukprot:Seg13836.3 transcript_id=Seg13836.3/GoldUCD/mRNA.D3Y31 product="hypothetical protein" protein_id=Seg13836.3/GoldUCD/D3Y31